MNKTVTAVIAILSTASLIGLYIWSSHHRYYIIPGTAGVAYEVDRKTGESWVLFGLKKLPQNVGNQSRHKEQELPYDEVAKINGNAGFGYNGDFSGKLYNGSDWVVTKLIVNVSAKEADHSIRWSRDFSVAVTIRPLTTESFSITVAGEHGIKEGPWMLKKVIGYKE